MKNNQLIKSFIIMILLAAVTVTAVSLLKPGGPLVKSTNEARAEEIITEMSLEEKVGQMFMGCFYKGTPSPEAVEKYDLGGVLLFSPSFSVSRDSLTSRLTSMDEVCSISPIIAVDEEGGDVVRVSANKKYRAQPFDPPRTLYKRGGIDAIVADAHEKNALLAEIGIDLNLGPVCDISTDPDDFMYSRSLGKNAKITADFIEAVVTACIEDGIGCSLKHFPGYGNAVDTHVGKAIDKRKLSQIMENDILPFKAGIDAGAHSVLISHNTVTSIDKTHPASLSPEIIKLLREDLGFEGVVITDDLIMGAVTEYGTASEIAVAAVLAGNDMLCTGNYKTQIRAVLNAVKSGKISEDRINASVKRILMMKLELGVIS